MSFFTERLEVRVEPALLDQIAAEAKATGSTMSSFVRSATVRELAMSERRRRVAAPMGANGDGREPEGEA